MQMIATIRSIKIARTVPATTIGASDVVPGGYALRTMSVTVASKLLRVDPEAVVIWLGLFILTVKEGLDNEISGLSTILIVPSAITSAV